MRTPHHRRRPGRKRLVAYALWFGAAAALIAYYCVTVLIGGSAPTLPAAAPADRSVAAPGTAAFSFLDQPRPVPALHFADAQGRDLTLADFRNRPVLLNIWATWCVPCRQEMPSLDRLQAKFGASQLAVLPLSIDRQGLAVVKQFYDELGLISLGVYLDPSGQAASELNTVGVPMTLLIDRDGQEIGRKVGPAEWDSREIVALIRERLGVTPHDMQASP